MLVPIFFNCLRLHSLQAYGALMMLKDQAVAATAVAAATAASDPAAAAAASAALCPISCTMSLETLARLSWSDDEVRELLAASGELVGSVGAAFPSCLVSLQGLRWCAA